jgi:large subunit ribosomal protein L17
MKKKVFGRKLSRSRPAREALFTALTRALILSGKIVTTKAKAKAVQRTIEKYVSLAKKGDLSSRRRVLAGMDNSKSIVKTLFQKVAPAFSAKQSGFTRIVLLPKRKGDNAEMARIEWTEKVELKEEKKEEKVKAVKKETKVVKKKK